MPSKSINLGTNNPILLAVLLIQKARLSKQDFTLLESLEADLDKTIDFLAFSEVTLEELSEYIEADKYPEAIEQSLKASIELNAVRKNLMNIQSLLTGRKAKKEEGQK